MTRNIKMLLKQPNCFPRNFSQHLFAKWSEKLNFGELVALPVVDKTDVNQRSFGFLFLSCKATKLVKFLSPVCSGRAVASSHR